MRLTKALLTLGVSTLVAAALSAQIPVPAPVPAGQARDAQGQPQPAATGTALLAGRVTMAGTGQPVYGVRVTLSGAEIRGTRSVFTDDDGLFAFAALPAGTYQVRGTLNGHIAGTYGQKQPGKPGTAIVLADGQQLKDASFEIGKGGVISGTVYDEKSRPSIGTPVRVMRWTMNAGERTLSVAGTATTDDRGVYRVFNLQPGEYMVSAVPRNSSLEIMTAVDQEAQARVSELMARGLVAAGDVSFSVNIPAGQSGEPALGYAPVFYPGTTQLASARSIKIGISEEQLGVDFQLVRTNLASITGQVIITGQSPTTVQLRLVNTEGSALGVGQQSVRAQQNGTFTFRNVIPGQYQIYATAQVASANNAQRVALLNRELQVLQNQGPVPPPPPMPPGMMTTQRLWAQTDVFVDGSYSPAVTLSLQDGLTVSGSVAFNGSAPLPQGNQRVRVTMTPLGQPLASIGIGSLNATADPGGRFTIHGVVPGRYRVSASGAQGWSLKNVLVNGVDALDFPLVVEAGGTAPNLLVQFGDRNTELKGTMTGADGQPASSYSVVIFPEDQRYWVPYARRMRSTRPSTTGQFSFMGLPPGDYRIAAVVDLETGEINDPEFLRQLLPSSVSVRLVEGQPASQDIQVR